jgi:hypothetical protein
VEGSKKQWEESTIALARIVSVIKKGLAGDRRDGWDIVSFDVWMISPQHVGVSGGDYLDNFLQPSGAYEGKFVLLNRSCERQA